MKAIGVLMVVGVLLVPGTLAAHEEGQVATCERGPVTSGPADWRKQAVAAGPLGVFRNPLGHMSETESGQLVTKMPVITEGSTSVTLSVPPKQRHRVFLYYGRLLDRSGNPTTQLGRARGFSEVVFEPCASKPQTGWPGGIRVKKGRKPVRLTVRVGDNPEPILLPLGKPKPFD